MAYGSFGISFPAKRDMPVVELSLSFLPKPKANRYMRAKGRVFLPYKTAGKKRELKGMGGGKVAISHA